MRVSRKLSLSVVVLIPLVLLTGCALENRTSPTLNAGSDGMRGTLMGGQQPVLGATVSIYEVGSTSYGVATTTPKASVISSTVDGSFSFAANAYTCTAASTPMYLVATGGVPGGYSANASLALMALVPQCATGKTSYININEVTTAAAVLAAGQFMGATLGSSAAVPQIGATCTSCATGTYNKGLVAAFSNTYPMLVDNRSGNALASGTTSGVAITRETAKLNTIANVLASCVNSTGATTMTETTTVCGQLFTDVNATSASPRPFNTIQAALEMDLYPYYNVSTVYNLGSANSPFIGLSSAPHDWTTAISYTTASFGLGIKANTSSNLDIDASGDIWFPSNQTGAAGLAYFSPSSTSFNGPYGGTNLTYPQYVAIDQSTPAVAFTTDMNSSYVTGTTTTSPTSISTFSSAAYTTGGPLALDDANNVVVAGNGTAVYHLYVIPSGRTSLAKAGSYSATASPNGVGIPLGTTYTDGALAANTTSACAIQVLSNDGTQYIEDSIGGSSCVTGGLLPLASGQVLSTTSTGYICFGTSTLGYTGCNTFNSLSTPKSAAYDGLSQLWVANSANASVAAFANNYVTTQTAIGSGYLHGTNYGTTLTAPYGIGIDASGNVWVSNASCIATTSTSCSASGFTLTEIVGAAGPTITPVSMQNVGATATVGTRPTN